MWTFVHTHTLTHTLTHAHTHVHIVVSVYVLLFVMQCHMMLFIYLRMIRLSQYLSNVTRASCIMYWYMMIDVVSLLGTLFCGNRCLRTLLLEGNQIVTLPSQLGFYLHMYTHVYIIHLFFTFRSAT